MASAAFLLALAVGVVDWRRGRAAAKGEKDRDEFQKRIAEEQVEIQKKSYELALRVHEATLEPEPATEPEQEPEAVATEDTVNERPFNVRFAYRDSS